MTRIHQHLKLSHAAYLLDKSVRWLRTEIDKGNIDGFMVGGEIVVDVESLQKYLDSTKLGPQKLE